MEEIVAIHDDEIQRTATRLIAGTWPQIPDLRLDLDTAYRIQDEAFCQRLERGERAAGIAMTSFATATGEPTIVTSWLTDVLLDIDALNRSPDMPVDFQITVELGFIVGKQINEPLLTPTLALAAVDRVHSVLHVRHHDEARDEPASLAAMNGRTACVCLDPVSADVAGLDLQLEACVLEVDGQFAHAATGAALLGNNPAHALGTAMNAVVARGHVIEPGWVVLTGPLASPILVRSGTTVSARFTRLGALTMRVP